MAQYISRFVRYLYVFFILIHDVFGLGQGMGLSLRVNFILKK